MGYSTDFFGKVQITPPLNAQEVAYLTKFSETRRMHLKQGPYFVSQPGYAGQEDGPDVVDYNEPPPGQPGLWCQWVPADDGAALGWNGAEKFYEAEAWMQYLVEHFLRPGAKAASSGDPQFAGFTFNHRVEGRILASGEEFPDLWRIDVADNQVSTYRYELGDEDLGRDGFDEDEDGDKDGERAISLGGALYTLGQNPDGGVEAIGAWLDSLDPSPSHALVGFLQDLAAVLPDPHREKLSRVVAAKARLH
ncbi:MAG: hypothetical protein QM765_22490 [Myxococcales bacterium]